MSVSTTPFRTQLGLTPLIAIAALAGCATGDSVSVVFQDPTFQGGPFSNVLVIGVHDNIPVRRRFESALAAAISESGTVATPGLAVMEAAAPVDRDSVMAAVRRTDAEAVIITRVLDVESSVSITDGRSTTAAQRRDDVPLVDFFRYEYVTYTDPMMISTVRTVVLSTDLYDVSSEMRIWSIESSSFEKETTDDIIDSSSRTISAQLGRDGLIR